MVGTRSLGSEPAKQNLEGRRIRGGGLLVPLRADRLCLLEQTVELWGECRDCHVGKNGGDREDGAKEQWVGNRLGGENWA